VSASDNLPGQGKAVLNLRYSADYRTLMYAFVLFPGVALAHYVDPRLCGWLLPLSLYMGFCAGVFAHNHNHCPTFKSRGLNNFFGGWLSIFYGYMLFGWIPTHNLNHHKLVNRAGDATITWRYTKRHTFWVAVTYFFVSAYFQSGPIREYIEKARQKKGPVYRQIVLQASMLIGAHVAMLALGIVLHGLMDGFMVYFFGFAIPAAFSLWSMMFINYIQHVHCDPWSPDNHSRNFVSRVSNWFVFEAGYHTVHHEHPGTHWSQYPRLHAARAALIAPELNEHSIVVFCIKNYVLGLVFPRFRTRQVGRAAYDDPAADLTTDKVSAVEAGVNAEMA
jgi:fatty acid desaturase